MKKVGELNGRIVVAITPQEVAEVASLIKEVVRLLFEPVVGSQRVCGRDGTVICQEGIAESKLKTAAKPDNPKRHKTCTICHNDYIDPTQNQQHVNAVYKCMPE